MSQTCRVCRPSGSPGALHSSTLLGTLPSCENFSFVVQPGEIVTTIPALVEEVVMQIPWQLDVRFSLSEDIVLVGNVTTSHVEIICDPNLKLMLLDKVHEKFIALLSFEMSVDAPGYQQLPPGEVVAFINQCPSLDHVKIANLDTNARGIAEQLNRPLISLEVFDCRLEAGALARLERLKGRADVHLPTKITMKGCRFG